MSPRQIDVHPEAVAEARAAAQWYRERSVFYLTEAAKDRNGVCFGGFRPTKCMEGLGL